MAPDEESDWSDSDEEEILTEVETSVLLGVPDGVVATASDAVDVAVSRIGGHPAFLPAKEPDFATSHCKSCNQPMELLVQLWCPFEDSPMDRALYVWGCSVGKCQGKEGSVRAFRGLRFNEKYAAKLDKKLAIKKEKERVKAEKAAEEVARKKAAMKTNPFAMKGSAAPNPFGGLGGQIFGGAPAPDVPTPSAAPAESEDSPSDSESEGEDEELLTAMAAATLKVSPWASVPSYPPLYLNTTSEYLPPPPRSKDANVPEVQEAGGQWATESYENSMNLDQVFERFTKRVAYEGEQCIRYELNGIPLPFQSDKVFDILFPTPIVPKPKGTTNKNTVPALAPKRTFSLASVPACPLCGSKRIFECQLMPNLISVLSKDDARLKPDPAEKNKVKLTAEQIHMGMGWGTAMIFSCEKDCCRGASGEVRECMIEEKVLVQWDDTVAGAAK